MGLALFHTLFNIIGVILFFPFVGLLAHLLNKLYPDRKTLLTVYLAKHPMLKDFVQSPSCALLQIRVETYYLVRRFQNVMELHIK
jgi:phosphate:Na+ symporter